MGAVSAVENCSAHFFSASQFGQARALLLHVFGVPPLLDGEHAGLAEVLDLAGGGRLVHRVAAGRLPDLHGHVQIAGLEAGELGEIVGLHVFDVEPGVLQRLAHEPRGDQLPGPVVQRELYGVFRVFGERRSAYGKNRQRRHRGNQ